MTTLGLQSLGSFRAERRRTFTHGWAPGFEESFRLLVRRTWESAEVTFVHEKKNLWTSLAQYFGTLP